MIGAGGAIVIPGMTGCTFTNDTSTPVKLAPPTSVARPFTAAPCWASALDGTAKADTNAISVQTNNVFLKSIRSPFTCDLRSEHEQLRMQARAKRKRDSAQPQDR